MTRKSLLVLVLMATGLVATHARQDAKPEAKPDAKVGRRRSHRTDDPLAFDTSEGTWMNVDVSPDGTQVVFDLLGDVYLMPIGGGAAPARRLTSGPMFDMQPRFSPDGKRIALTSDRDGLWNIWTMDLDGKDARQISRERRWFVNSPTWSPDGRYIYARDATSSRSARLAPVRSGCITAPDRRRTAGHRAHGLAERRRRAGYLPRRQHALLQQGRHTRPDLRVQQGPQRHHLRHHPRGSDGRERRAVSVQAAVTPQVSPDGKSLAYVRRVRLQSFLYVRDLESGRDRQVFANVDKDLQEAWAIHGLYARDARGHRTADRL